jgi:hypothetical protein
MKYMKQYNEKLSEQKIIDQDFEEVDIEKYLDEFYELSSKYEKYVIFNQELKYFFADQIEEENSSFKEPIVFEFNNNEFDFKELIFWDQNVSSIQVRYLDGWFWKKNPELKVAKDLGLW